ncbi:PTS sugar transporter subunit IIA [Niallia circulans]|jgi:sugar PTS system EIIA component|uniref:PTS sugar transporter subunit IIA n=1 Tax=Niallia circulans TaxID=1397 RepID=UPI00352C111B
MLGIFKKNNLMFSPVNGTITRLEDVNDNVFSSKMMGDGFAVVPSESVIVSPVSGEVTMLAETKHAIGIKTSKGTEILIHIGIDTVNLKGNGFNLEIKNGQKVKAGQTIGTVDWNLIEENQIDPTVMIIFTCGTTVFQNELEKYYGKYVTNEEAMIIRDEGI